MADDKLTADLADDIDDFFGKKSEEAALPAPADAELPPSRGPQLLQGIEKEPLVEAANKPVKEIKKDPGLFSLEGLTNRLEAAALGGIDTTTAGFTDEILGGLTALGGSGEYGENKKAVEQYMKEQMEKHPYWSGAGKFLGALVPSKAALSQAKAAKGMLGGFLLGAGGGAVTGGISSIGHSEGDIFTEEGRKKIKEDIKADLPANLAFGGAGGVVAEGLNFKTSKDPYYRTLAKARGLGLEGIDPSTDVGRDILQERLKETLKSSSGKLMAPIKEGQKLWDDAISGFKGPITAKAGFAKKVQATIDELEKANFLGDKGKFIQEVKDKLGDPNSTLSDFSLLETQLFSKAREIAKDPAKVVYSPLFKDLADHIRTDIVQHNIGKQTIDRLKNLSKQDKSVLARFLSDDINAWDPNVDVSNFNKMLERLTPERMQKLDLALRGELEPIARRMSYGTGIGEPERNRLQELANWIKNVQKPKDTSKIDVDELVKQLENTSLEQSVLRNYIGDRKIGNVATMGAAKAALGAAEKTMTGPEALVKQALVAPFSTRAQNLYGRMGRAVTDNVFMDLEKPENRKVAQWMPWNISEQSVRKFGESLAKSDSPVLSKAGKNLVDAMSKTSGNASAALFAASQTQPGIRKAINNLVTSEENPDKTLEDIIEEQKQLSE